MALIRENETWKPQLRFFLHDCLYRVVGRIMFYNKPYFLTCKLISLSGMKHLNFYKSGVFDKAYSYFLGCRLYIWWMNDSVMSRTLQGTVTTSYSTIYNSHEFSFISTEDIYVFCSDVRRNSDYSPVQHWLISCCNWAEPWNRIQVIGSLWRVGRIYIIYSITQPLLCKNNWKIIKNQTATCFVFFIKPSSGCDPKRVALWNKPKRVVAWFLILF